MSLTPTDTSVGEVKKIVCDRAVEIANDEIDKVPELGPGFRETPTGAKGFCISYLGGELDTVPTERRAELQALVTEVGKRAVKQAIREHIELIVGLMIGEARHGRNFFDDSGEGMSVIA